MHTRLIGHKVFKLLSVIFKKKLRYKITGAAKFVRCSLKGQSHQFLVSLRKAKRHIFIYGSLKIMVQ